MFEILLRYFDAQSWKYRLPYEDKKIAALGISTQNGKFHCILDVDEKDKKMIFFSIFPVNISERMRPAMAELITRVNYVIYFGNFDLDFEDGEIRFRTSVIYEDSVLTNDFIEHVIVGNIAAMNRYFELFNSFAVEKFTMHEAIENLIHIEAIS